MEKTTILKTSNGDSLESDEAVAFQSQSLNHQTEDDCVDKEISIPNGTGKKTLTMPKKIVLISSDNESFEVDEAVARQFQTLNHLLKDDFSSCGIPIPNVTSKTLANVIKYCKKHADAASAVAENKISANSVVDEDLKKWDADFVKIDMSSLFDLTAAADTLDITELLDLVTTAVADMMKKYPGEINKLFNTATDF